MTARGHNENAVRLSALAGDAQIALDRVARGEADAIDGWLAYGAALNEGRGLFPSDEQFGQWIAEVVSDNLSVTPNDHERSAAMWAAANADQFEEARAAGKARTVRGIHAKWKELEAEREAAAKAEADAIARKAAAEKARQEAEQNTAKIGKREHVEQRDAEEQGQPAVPGEGAKCQPQPAAERQPDPQAEARKGLSGLTREAIEDDVIGLRAENDELRAKLRAAQAERDRFKAANKELTSGSDAGRTIGKLQREIVAVKHARDEALAAAKRMEYRLKQAERERDEAVSSLQSQEIAL